MIKWKSFEQFKFGASEFSFLRLSWDLLSSVSSNLHRFEWAFSQLIFSRVESSTDDFCGKFKLFKDFHFVIEVEVENEVFLRISWLYKRDLDRKKISLVENKDPISDV